jgi:hypothetical protein
MIELYILVTLAAIGYMVNSSSANKKVVLSHLTIPKAEIPQGQNVYQSQQFNEVQADVAKKAAAMYKKSLDPVKSGVVSKTYPYDKEDIMANKVKLLSGEYIDKNDFKFKNMTPYFGGRMKQNLDENANKSLLETFTGVNSADFKRKCEVDSFYDTTKNVTNINGMQNRDDFYKERMVAPRVRNNITPVEKITVGPGIGKGFTSNPTGGFQQFDVQDMMMPKCVDQLRVATNPKVTYAGRTVDGMKSKLRGEVGKMEKNRVTTFYEQTPDNYLRTTGAYLKQSEIPEYNVKNTNRLDTTTQYVGSAMTSSAKARIMDPSVRGTSRSQFGEYGLRNAALYNIGKGERDDFGKSKIMVFANERDITSTRVYQGNLTSLIKALVTPVTDAFKNTRKDEMVDNPRHFGNMNIQIPDKPTMYDPNDVARTTIKETTVHESVNGNLKGNEKGTMHDPNDVARTTLKETTIHEYVNGNLKGHEKITIHDPNDIARTTIKETLIHDDTGTGTITGPKQLFVYDPDEVAKTTLRETLERMDYEMNISGGAKKGTIYDPADVARTTMKETLEDLTRDGNIDRVEGMGDYNTTEYKAKHTQKQFTSDKDYFGTANKQNRDGYKTANFDAPDTQKQFLSDIEYYGGAEASSDKKQMSYDDMYNAYISATKESVLNGREPTQSGKKSYVSGDCISLSHKKQECDMYTERVVNNIDKISNNIPSSEISTFTRAKKDYDETDRLDPSILKAYLENPYTKPLNSVA